MYIYLYLRLSKLVLVFVRSVLDGDDENTVDGNECVLLLELFVASLVVDDADLLLLVLFARQNDMMGGYAVVLLLL